MRPLCIAHVLPSFGMGGQERVALELARAHRAEGHRVLAFAIDPRPGDPLQPAFEVAGVAARVIAKRGGVDPGLVLRLSAAFLRARVDVVHTHNPLALTYGAPAGRLARAAVVHTKHGENLVSGHAGRRLALRRFAARFAHAFVAVTAATADAARWSRDVAERKLQVIPNGIDVRRFAPGPEARGTARRELRLPPGAAVIGSVGRLAPEKNHQLLVRALAGALGDDLQVVLVGDGPERPALARAVAEAGAGRFVHLLGARTDVHRLLPAFDVFAQPSLSEGLPLVILEAMAAGLPVVASAVGGIPDVVEEGRAGYLVPPGDAAALRAVLLALARDPERRAVLGRRGREAAEARHSLEAMSEAYLALYRRVLGGPGADPAAGAAARARMAKERS